MSVTPEKPNEPLYIGRVISMWHDGSKQFHALWFSHGCETILGETSNPRELFLVDSCQDLPLSAVVEKVHVATETENMEADFFVKKKYYPELGRFEDLQTDTDETCPSCVKEEKEVSRLYKWLDTELYVPFPLCLQNSPPVGVGEPVSVSGSQKEYSSFEFAGETYAVGNSVYLPSDTYTFPVKASKSSVAKSQEARDPAKYPELYRKSEYIKGSNDAVPKPFQIGE